MLPILYFHPELIEIVKTFPRFSNEWKDATNKIGEDIKNCEADLRLQFGDTANFRIVVRDAIFELRKHSGSQFLRLCYSSVSQPEVRPVIELPLDERVGAYGQFPDLFQNIAASEFVKFADEKAQNVKAKPVLELVREAFDRVKIGALSGPALEKMISELKRLRDDAPRGDADLKSKAGWFKKLAELLANSDIFQQVFAQVKTQIPQIWSQLTFAQKLKVGAIGPVIGAGTYLGGMGLAGGGSAVGIPVVMVVLLFLLLSNSLVDFLDFVIKRLSIIVQSQPDPESVSKAFESILNAALNALFGKDHDLGSAQRVTDEPISGTIDPRQYESIAIGSLAKKYGGIGYVTRYSSDGGIDGYIVCDRTKEVVLVQAKHYECKVGFPEATQYLGTYLYWKKAFESKFPYPISKMALACSTDYSIEARRVAEAFPDLLVLETVKV